VKKLFNVYRVLAFVVGVLLIVMVFIGMPLKYFLTEGSSWQDTGANIVSVVGVSHGMLYMVYIVVAFALAVSARWTVPFTVLQERTKLILVISKKGTARTVTALLLDDDNQPVAGQKLVFAVNGKTVATLTTNASGKATFTKANPSQTVKVTFAAVTGKWLGTTAQAKV